MPWEIVGEAGPYHRPDSAASGWIWEIRNGDETRQLLVELTDQALAIDDHLLPPDTVEAIETEGLSEVERVLGRDDPPRVVQCGTDGCSPVAAE